MNASHRPAFNCRACGSADYEEILDLGRVPLANAFVMRAEDDDDADHHPLCLILCSECRLLQIREEVNRDALFTNYLWVTSTSAGAKDHAEWLSARLRERFLEPRTGPVRLVEIASNDGFFLQHYRDAGFDILGVDPSNLANEADARGLPSVRAFFGREVAARIRAERGPADLIVARNVLGHASELQDLVAGIGDLLAEDGTFVVEAPYAYRIREEVQYDYIFHEHLSYFTLTAMHNLLARFGLTVVNIEFVEMNGGSVLCEIRRAPAPAADTAMLAFERFIALESATGWLRFRDAVLRQRQEFVDLLRTLRAEHKRVVGYGAAAKFMTMLNYCGIGRDLIAAVGDANPRKQGLLCPGVRIPVVSPQQLMDLKPDFIVIGAWNFKDEMIRQLRERHDYKGAFIVPLPLPSIERQDAT